ncbi:MAG: hypothetical protein HQL68_08715 [Magnetococcales bacterium]|nr:hypothetical protein [Magnetococcales bacterium]
MIKTHEEIISLLEIIDSEHIVILKWADELIDDIAKERSQQYISEKAFSFKDFLLEHILKEDAELYPYLTHTKTVDTEMRKLHDIYAKLDDFFMSTPAEIVEKFKIVVPLVKARIEYEDSMLKELVKNN